MQSMKPVPMGLFFIATLLAIFIYQNKSKPKEFTRAAKGIALWALATYALITIHLI